LYRFPFEGVGDVSFERIIGRTCDVLKINMPSFFWDSGRGSPEPVMHEIALGVLAWFKKMFCVETGLLKRCSGGHFALPVRNPDLMKVAQTSTVRIGEYMLDSSPPENAPEFESIGFDALERLLLLPDKVKDFEKRMDLVERNVERLVASMEVMMGKMDTMLKLFDAPKKPDELRDVA
jgi:hypothetical protein